MWIYDHMVHQAPREDALQIPKPAPEPPLGNPSLCPWNPKSTREHTKVS